MYFSYIKPIYLFTDFANIKSESITYPSKSFVVSKSEPVVEEPCLCSALKNVKSSFLNNPTEILHKILRSNDLFSYNQESVSSPMCCESHEHVQEDTVFFEFNPKAQVQVEHPAQPNSVPIFPLIWDNVLPNKTPLPSMPIKPKAIEIFFFPKKKDMNTFDFSKLSKKKEIGKKNEIQVVGDKELRNEFKNFKLKPAFPILTKKDEVRNYDNTVTQAAKRESPVIVEDMTFSFAQKVSRDEKQREKEEEKEEKKIEDMKEEIGAETPATVLVPMGDDSTTIKPLNTI